jgi:hypothetical protein
VRRHPRAADMAMQAYALLAVAPHEAIDMRLLGLTGEDCRAL